MNSHSGIRENDNNHNKDKTKATTIMPIAGVIVAAALLLSVGFFNSYNHTALAQEELTDTPPPPDTTDPTAPPTTVGMENPCDPALMTGVTDENVTRPDLATPPPLMDDTTTTTEPGIGQEAFGQETVAPGTENVTAPEVAENQTALQEVRIHIEEACFALQVNDTQGALMHLDLAIGVIDAQLPTNVTAPPTVDEVPVTPEQPPVTQETPPTAEPPAATPPATPEQPPANEQQNGGLFGGLFG